MSDARPPTVVSTGAAEGGGAERLRRLERPPEQHPKTLLLLSHFYPPDPAAVGQYMAEAATYLARRGYRVLVLTSARGFEDPTHRYPSQETRNGVEIHRLPLASFGKSSIQVRLLGALSFVAQAALRGLFTRRLAGILVSTSPPMAPAAVILISKLRRTPFTFWVMDINPDQAIALGRVRPDAFSARLQEHLMRSALRNAGRVVPLDRFMCERLETKVGKDVLAPKTSVVPLWPLSDVEPVSHEENPFRHEHGLDGKFVVMYSGNLGINAPPETLLPAMLHFKKHPEIVFVFIGGGTARPLLEAFVELHRLENVRLLPYQPLERLKYSLSAGDVHIVSLEEHSVGICHPSKVYGAMAVGRPILYIGPEQSHIADLLDGPDDGVGSNRGVPGWRVEEGDDEGLCNLLANLKPSDESETGLLRTGDEDRPPIAQSWRAQLVPTFCDLIEGLLQSGVPSDR